MALTPIGSRKEYLAALDKIDQLWDAPPGTDEFQVMMELVGVVEDYEDHDSKWSPSFARVKYEEDYN